MPIELVPILIPAVVIVAVAIRLVRHAAPPVDRVLDLRDDPPAVPTAAASRVASRPVPSPGPLTGALVEPVVGGTLGARMRSASSNTVGAPSTEEASATDDADAVRPVRGKVVIGRRRSRPLIAQR